MNRLALAACAALLFSCATDTGALQTGPAALEAGGGAGDPAACVCPMHPDDRGACGAKCKQCGMALEKAGAAADAGTECTCGKHGGKCEGGCCSACSADNKADGGACKCKDGSCKSCPLCKKGKAKGAAK